MKVAFAILCFLRFSVSALAQTPPQTAQDNPYAALSAAVQHVSDEELEDRVRKMALALHSGVDRLQRDNNGRQVAEELRAEGQKPGLKGRLLKFFHDFDHCVKNNDHGLKKAGLTALELGACSIDVAADLIFVPFHFAESFTNSFATGESDDSETGASQWIAVGVGDAIYTPVIFDITVAAALAAGIPLVVKIGIGTYCSIPSVTALPTVPGAPLSNGAQFCSGAQGVDDDIDDLPIASGEKAGAWVGQDSRKVGKDLKALFAKLFHGKPKQPPESAEPALP